MATPEVVSGGNPVTIKDEGVVLTNDVASVDFQGDGVTGTALGNSVVETIPGGGGPGAEAFTDLTDVPSSYSGQSGKVVKVKSTEDGLEFGTDGTGSPAGNDTNIQFNNNGAFGASNNLNFNYTDGILEIAQGKLESSVAKTVVPPTELLLNPSYEAWNTTLGLTNWQSIGGSYTQSLDAHTGTYAVELQGTGGGLEGLAGIAQQVTETEGDNYQATFWAKGDGKQAILAYTYNDELNQYFWDFTTGAWVNTDPTSDELYPFDLTADYAEYTSPDMVTVPAGGAFTIILVSEDDILIDTATLKKDGTGDDILTDGDFEDWTSNVGSLEDWDEELYFGGGSPMISQDSPGRTGSYSVKMTNDDSTAPYVGQLVTGLTSGNSYVASVYGMTVSVPTGVNIAFYNNPLSGITQVWNFTTQIWDNTGSFELDSDHNYRIAITSSTWTQIQTTLLAPTNGQIYFVIANVDNNTELHIDDASFQSAGSSAPPVTIWDLNDEQTQTLDSSDSVIKLEVDGHTYFEVDGTGTLKNDDGLDVSGQNTGGNTGDETQTTIKTKLGQASGASDGWLSESDWNTFNNKEDYLGYTPENVANKSTDTTLGGGSPSDTLYPTQAAVKSYVDSHSGGGMNFEQGTITNLSTLSAVNTINHIIKFTINGENIMWNGYQISGNVITYYSNLIPTPLDSSFMSTAWELVYV